MTGRAATPASAGGGGNCATPSEVRGLAVGVLRGEAVAPTEARGEAPMRGEGVLGTEAAIWRDPLERFNVGVTVVVGVEGSGEAAAGGGGASMLLDLSA